MDINRPVKIGIFVSLVLGCGIWGLFYLRGLDLFNKESKYYVVYDDIGGLVVSNPVQIKGLKVGQVTKISFTDNQYNGLIVEIVIKHGYKIPKGSIAKIYSSDLMGSKSIELIPGKSNESLNENDTLKSDIEKSLQDQVRLEVLPIKKKAESLISSMDSIFSGLEYVFNKKTKDNLMTSITNIKLTFENLEHTSKKLDTIITTSNLSSILQNINAISSTIRSQNKNITTILSNLGMFSDTLVKMNVSKTFSMANHTLLVFDSIATKISLGEGTIGQLVKNDSLFKEMKNASKSLDLLLNDVKTNPKRYVHFSVFGSNSSTKTKQTK
jgi:phospholipid/cholesterol/gamma-HCH transport system substrate-binding protein